MKICIHENVMKICNQTDETCNHCAPEGSLRVDRLHGIDLVIAAARTVDHAVDLGKIIGDFLSLNDSKGINKSDKKILSDLTTRLYNLADGIFFSGATVFRNLYFDLLTNSSESQNTTAEPE